MVDAVQAALKTEMREIKKIQQALRQLADEVHFTVDDTIDDGDDGDFYDDGDDDDGSLDGDDDGDEFQVEGQLHENERVADKLRQDLRQKR